MKIVDLVYDTLLEEVKNKGLFNILLTKWYGETPTEENNKVAEDIYNGFSRIKEGLNVNNANVKTFLSRFDGTNTTTREKFDQKNLKDIRYYSLRQILFILKQFNIDVLKKGVKTPDAVPEVLIGKDLPSTTERIEASKSLWYGKNQFLIIDEGDFRVYAIPNIPTSIYFGYYENYVTSNIEPFQSYNGSYMQWCTTRHMRTQNLWSTYRDRRTFYFIIDETKNPETTTDIQVSQYYLCALQYSTDSVTKYRMTSILNNGSDPVFTKEEIIRIYPKLAPHFDLIVPVEYDAKNEAGEDTDIVNLINEREGNEYEFSIVEEELKTAYIGRGKPITKVKSWEHMSENLKKTYIDITNRAHIFERFCPNLLNVILNSPSESKSLDRRLKIIGITDGIGHFVRQLLAGDFELVRKSITNPNIVILRKKSNNRYGIYDTSKSKFVTLDGVVYGGLGDLDLFTKMKNKLHFDNEDKSYMSTPYVRETTTDTFYTLYDTDTAGPEKVDAYILSQKAWDTLKRDLESSNPEQQHDINELG